MVNTDRKHLPAGSTSWLAAYEAEFKAAHPKYAAQDKIVVADCDGVITTSQSLYTEGGKSAKIYGAYDKEMVRLMQRLGWKFVFVSTDRAGFGITKARFDHLNSDGSMRLLPLSPRERRTLVEFHASRGTPTCFVGDSLSDIDALDAATVACTTANAPAEVKKYCDVVSELDGGWGGFADALFEMNVLLAARMPG